MATTFKLYKDGDFKLTTFLIIIIKNVIFITNPHSFENLQSIFSLTLLNPVCFGNLL